jgi:predicted RNase H-like nuclease
MGERDSAIDAETQSRRSMAKVGDDWRRRYHRFNQTTGTHQLTMKQREERAEAEAEVDEKAEVDSIDSLICACDSPMPR